MTLDPFVENSQLPEGGVSCFVTHLDETTGFIVHNKHLTSRRRGELVTYILPIPGHGDDVVACEHADGTVGAYWIHELMKVWHAPTPHACSVRGCKKTFGVTESFGALRLSLCHDCKVTAAGYLALGRIEL